MNTIRLLTLITLTITLVACGGKTPMPEPVEETPMPPVVEPVKPPPRPPELTAEQKREAAMRQLLGQRTLYFDYDESDIRPEFVDIIAAHAWNLSRNPSQRILLEGHCDERGSREYNIGLGERRAHAVRRALLLQGVSADQISTISYGEERPAEMAHNESAWARNRRAEIVYR